MREPIIFLHNLDGRPVAVRVGRDRIVLRTVIIDGHKIEVSETVTEIARLIRDLKELQRE
jgi:hypothetical protein